MLCSQVFGMFDIQLPGFQVGSQNWIPTTIHIPWGAFCLLGWQQGKITVWVNGSSFRGIGNRV